MRPSNPFDPVAAQEFYEAGRRANERHWCALLRVATAPHKGSVAKHLDAHSDVLIAATRHGWQPEQIAAALGRDGNEVRKWADRAIRRGDLPPPPPKAVRLYTHMPPKRLPPPPVSPEMRRQLERVRDEMPARPSNTHGAHGQPWQVWLTEHLDIMIEARMARVSMPKVAEITGLPLGVVENWARHARKATREAPEGFFLRGS